MPKNGIAGSYGNSMFNFLRKHHTVFHSGCTILHSYQQVTRVLISPLPPQHFLFSTVMMTAILMGVKQHLVVVLICISLVTSVVEYLFMCLLAICISVLEKCFLKSFIHFFNVSCLFFVVEF